MNLELSVPYTGDSAPYPGANEILQDMIEFNNLSGNCINEIYLSGPQSFSGSGRVTSEIDDDEFVNIIDRLHKTGLSGNLAMNSVCEGKEW
jgi:hypothetical protein